MTPILFSTPMVRAILDGRKTMTRRVIKPQPEQQQPFDGVVRWSSDKKDIGGMSWGMMSTVAHPKCQPGDVLWVRETWCNVNKPGIKPEYYYRADALLPDVEDYNPKEWTWHPSIFMPKEACRIFLRVTDVRVERIQDILCGDMKREGCIPDTVTGGQYQQWQHDYWIPLWDSINAKRGYGWETNCWVWVISFERCEKEGDNG